MKTNIFSILLINVALLTVLVACKKNDIIGSAPEQKVNISTYNYLKSKTGVFDSLVKLIDRAGMQPLIDSAGQTIFAVTNYSVISYLAQMENQPGRVSKGPFTSDSVNVDDFRKNFRSYLFSGNITRATVGDSTDYTSKNSLDPAKYRVFISTVSGDVTFSSYINSVKYVSLRQVYTTPEPYTVGPYVFQTSDIITQTGVIQVLPNAFTLFNF